MARSRWFVAVSLLLAAATLKSQARSSSPDTAQITLGHSVAPLYRGWKFSVGDSPTDPRTGRPLWAEPDFDDSKWESMDLTPADGAFDPTMGVSGYVPGWTARGHQGYWGYAWYRIRIDLASQPGQELALAGPIDQDDAYEVFANGVRLGSFGDFSRRPPTVYYSQPEVFHLPPADANGGPSTVLAFRFWMMPGTLIQASDAGGFHTVPIVGEASTVMAQYQNSWLQLIRAYALTPVEAAFYIILGLVSFSLLFFDRTDRVYAWIGAAFLIYGISNGVVAFGSWTQLASIQVYQVFQEVFTRPIEFAAGTMVWWVWFRLRRPAWLPRAVVALMLAEMIANPLAQSLWFTPVSGTVSSIAHVVARVLLVTQACLLLGIVVDAIRLLGLEGWLALPPVLLQVVAPFSTDLRLLHFRAAWFPFGMQVVLTDAANLLAAGVLALLLIRRLVLSLRRQRRMALDVKQAQEVQQVILPEARTMLPGLVVDSEYRPALEVGGDFFQIIPHAEDDSLLIVAGDVAGKGLKAGMLVAVLVGAIRMAAEWNSDPAFVLRALNRRLMGRGDARATCLALRIAKDGTVTLANAGHMPPYLNDEPLEIEGSLPLGVVANLDCSILEFRLSENDRLLLVSDGVAEATNVEGELFGFERVLELVRSRPTAAQIAETAQAFGQEDDISVISVTRVPVAAPAMA